MGGESDGDHRNWGWCQAPFCAKKVRRGVLLCERHAEVLRRSLPQDLRDKLAGIDHASLLLAPLGDDTIAALDLVATALECVSMAEGREETWNQYRFRHSQYLRALKVGLDTPPAQQHAQSRLFAEPPAIRRGPWA